MQTQLFQTPVLFIAFNRPKPTRIVFESIRAIRPAKLFVAADGPRKNISSDAAKCKEVRKIVSAIDWDCEIHTLFRDQNLGCGLGPSTAINWFFENVEEGIILEDDCLPSKSFYLFCQTLLEYYRKSPKVMHISGDNYQYGRKRGKGSYYFSRYTHNWGWASWRRAWRYFNFELTPIEHRMHAWDAQWLMSVALQHGVAILPNVNLIKNIGFGPDATHTKEISRSSFLEAEEIAFPLVHLDKIKINKVADQFTKYSHFRNLHNLNMIWFYEIEDYPKKVVKEIKRIIGYLWMGIPSKTRQKFKEITKRNMKWK